MKPTKKISTFLASVSFIAIASCSAMAAGGTTFGPGGGGGGVVINTPQDYIIVDSYNMNGDLVVDDDVGPDSTEPVGILIVNGSNIDGALKVADGYAVLGSDTENFGTDPDATAAGVFSNMSQIEGGIVNEGSIGGRASATGNQALTSFAMAGGSVVIGDDDPLLENYDSGVVYADAFASAYDTAIALAGAVIQVTMETEAYAVVDNSGEIYASAEAYSTKNDVGAGSVDYDESVAGAIALGVGQVTFGSEVDMEIVNEGDINVLANAYASGYDTNNGAYAGAGGIGAVQFGIGAAAYADITNDGIIDVDVNATAHAVDGGVYESGDAEANALGVGALQIVFGEYEAATTFTNNYEVNVDVDVDATSYDEDAGAVGIGLGIGQLVSTEYEEASAEIINNDTLHVGVVVNATADSDAYADALVFGAIQFVNSEYGEASASLTNTAPLSIDATGTAIAYGHTAEANAYVIAAGQVVSSEFNTASANVTNGGSISADAHADAFGEDVAYADADAAAIDQFVVSEFDGASATVTNTKNIDAHAYAYASADTTAYGDAYASAGSFGVNQYGFAGGSIDFDVTNEGGNIHANATAFATADEGAYASASGAGVVQNAGSFIPTSDEVFFDITNNGTISAIVYAEANSDDDDAEASAEARGTYQRAFSIDGNIVANVTNGADDFIFGSAFATATGDDSATATAEALGVDQEVLTVYGEVNGTVTNDGQISAFARAMADAYGNDDTAEANATATGIDQYGHALESGSVALLVNNSGDVFATAKAYATGFDDGEAYAEALGIEQDSFAETNATSTVNNTGLIDAYAFASASALNVYGEAYATASGVQQGATSWDGDATASTTNTGNLSLITATAKAYAYSKYDEADGSASASGVNQDVDVFGSGLATASVTNEGTVQAFALTYATSVYDFASADAEASAVDQSVYSEYGEGLAQVFNSSDLMANAVAYALSIYSSASASASASGVEQDVYADNEATALVDNTGAISASAGAFAAASDSAEASAEAWGVDQEVGSNDGFALAQVLNAADSYITAYGEADAISYYSTARADAYATGIVQGVESYEEDGARATVTNNGIIWGDAFATATAYDSAEADAGAYGIDQFVWAGTGPATADVTNMNYIRAYANAVAESYQGYDNDINYNADASATATGVDQAAVTFNDTDPTTVTTTNSGTVEAGADARAFSDYGDAYAEAYVIGVDQYSHALNNGDSMATLINSADAGIFARASATADGWRSAYATAVATGVEQDVFSGLDNATASVINDGTIWAGAYANAVETGYEYAASYASANAYASGVNQFAVGGEFDGDATATLTNTSDFSIDGVAVAYATGTQSAYADAGAWGVVQTAFGGEDALVETVNSGRISAYAHAHASTSYYEGGTASAYAEATGLDQFVAGDDSSTARLANSGDITAEAYAHAYGYNSGYAAAEAVGHWAGSYEEALTLDVTNSADGNIWGYASALASDTAQALGAGAWYNNFQGDLEGTVVNAGLISGSAYADAYNTATASAFGVVMTSAGANNVELTNSGIVRAFAESYNAYATGIAVLGGGDGGDEYDLAVINNEGGVIYAGIVDLDNPEFVHRGNAINTRAKDIMGQKFGDAPNAVQINLTGGTADGAGKDIVEAFDLVSPEVQAALSENANYGYVYGNIQLTDDDDINVTDGATIFDGVINSDGEKIGTLDIYDGGKLVMVQNEVDGPSMGYVDELFINSSGTLVYELTPDNVEGSDYSQISANTANIAGGNFTALYTAGFYADETFYDNVIITDNRIGQFGVVDDNSALLKTTALYYDEGDDTADTYSDNVDLNVERIAFDEVEGMTKNQQAVGGAIENVYPDGIDEDSDFGKMVANLFTLDDGDYQNFLNQLTGAEHAEHLRSVLYSTRSINRIITERMECDGESYSNAKSASAAGAAKVGDKSVMPTADAPMATGCFEPGTASIWMRGFGQWNNLNGDDEAPGFDETQYGIYFGADYAFDENWFIGAAGGYFNSDADFDDWGGRSGTDYSYDGLQLAAYGGYDNSTYYLRGVVSYGNYEGESNRLISFKGSPIDPKGDPSSDTWSFYGETGYRFGVTDYANITPFAGLSLATATLDSFTEEDEGTGAALDVHESDASSVASVLGLRLDGDMAMGSGILTPTFSVAWMHEFQDTPEVEANFAGVSGTDFTVVASEVARDSILIDTGAKFDLSDSFNFGLYYNGQFNADYSSNAITARLGYRF